MPLRKPEWLFVATRRSSSSHDSTELSVVHHYARMTALFMVVLLTGFSSGIFIERFLVHGAENHVPAQSDVEAVSSVIEQNYYYRPTGPGEQAAFGASLEQSAINGMLASLDDQYTRYLLPDDAQVASDQLEGQYGGIGATLETVGGKLTVSRINPDTPASRAGLVTGDVVVRIDSQPVSEQGVEPQPGDLRGPVGSTVALLIQRPGATGPITVTIQREAIIVHPVSYEMIAGTNLFRIRIEIFGDRTTAELDLALAVASGRGASGIVLDLRGNGGGWVVSAQETIGRFLAADVGPALYEDGTPGQGGEQVLSIINPESGPTNMPVVVLVDRNTASAAEIVAGSLRDYDRAIVVGERTYGKGSVQRIFDFQDGASLRVTVAEWITPSRSRIQNEGIQPDVAIDSGLISTASGDPYINAGVAVLQSGVSRPSELIPASTAARRPLPRRSRSARCVA